MAGRLYRMAKVVSANPKSWGIVDANEISGFKRVAKLSDLYSIAECILSSSYGDGVTDGADAVGQIWHVSETNGDYKLTNWADRKSAAGWTKLSYGGDISVPVRDVQVDGTTVLSNGVANINLKSRLDNYATTDITNDLSGKIDKKADKATVTSLMDDVSGLNIDFNTFKDSKGQENGLATLYAQGYIPLDQLGNLDTVLFEVVTDLPNALNKIKKHIYLKTAGITGDKNVYVEYIYTGGITEHDVYDAAKWEKLGEVTAKTDLSEYYKKTEVYNKTEIDDKVTTLNDSINNNAINTFTAEPHTAARPDDEHKDQYKLNISLNNGVNKTVYIKPASSIGSGVMTYAQKVKLDGIEAGANKYTHPSYTSTPAKALYKINVDGFGHVSGYTEVTKSDITALGIPGSAPTVDAALSDTSTNAVQKKVINNAINTHKIDANNFNSIVNIADGTTRLLFFNKEDGYVNYKDDNSACYLISNETIDADKGVPKIGYSEDGSVATSYLLRDIDMVALTDTELNEILV